MELTDVYRIFHPTAAIYTFFTSIHGILPITDLMIVHKTSPSKYKNIKVIPSIFFYYSYMNLEINYKSTAGKLHKYVASNTLVNK